MRPSEEELVMVTSADEFYRGLWILCLPGLKPARWLCLSERQPNCDWSGCSGEAWRMVGQANIECGLNRGIREGKIWKFNPSALGEGQGKAQKADQPRTREVVR